MVHSVRIAELKLRAAGEWHHCQPGATLFQGFAGDGSSHNGHTLVNHVGVIHFLAAVQFGSRSRPALR